ncbi:exonuclease domain-containing protein [Oenococcus alcoholitolerans]|uniref:exonuclease domain-containing protein n=1 Tax=Oenococcus alcoholitolerans TaxID=931074 RepID=UPI003F72B327
MDQKSIFAIVDLETTAPFKEGGHIIQIGICYIHNWKIINNFQSFVNPGVKIPEAIVELTGITDNDVAKAPFFEEIAPLVRNQLAGTVFVAHNVRYDFPYLNGEFSRIAVPRLRSEYIDTVQLAQIAFPTLPSYKLDELVNCLGISLPRHHQADQDAAATGKLFLRLYREISDKSKQTLKNLSAISEGLIGNTGQFFELCRSKKEAKRIYKGIDISDLDIKDPDTSKLPDHYRDFQPDFDTSAQASRSVLRKRQYEFADIFSQKADNEHFISIFLRPRFGKSNACLLLARKLLEQKKRVLIVEENDHRRKMVLQKGLQFFPELFGRIAIPVTRKDFVNLDKLKNILKIPDSPTRQLAKMRVISWLSQTKSGSLSEIINGFPESLFEMFTSDDPQTDIYKRVAEKYSFPDIGITDLYSFSITSNELGKNYDIILFDSGRLPSVFSHRLSNDLSSAFVLNRVDFDLKKWYSSRSFSTAAELFESL